MFRQEKEERRKAIINFLKNNPQATYKKLKKEGLVHIERIFPHGLKEAFEAAGLNPPRTFERKTKEEKKKIIIKYIKRNPHAGGQNIAKDTKINIKGVFNNIREAFKEAGVNYPREENFLLRNRDREERRRQVIDLVKKEQDITNEEIRQRLKLNPYKIFSGFAEICALAGIENIGHGKKRTLRKKKKIIQFIKENPTATQREINFRCSTRIQGLFEHGIFGAYKEAGIEFPFERLKLHGAAKNEIKQRAEDFEKEIAQKLSGYGCVSRLVKTKRGKADIIFERNNKKTIIEVKDYLNKEIAQHEIRQLNKYLEDCNCNLGFLICHTKPKKDRFIINENEIFIIESHELFKIPEILDRGQ